MDNYDDDDEGTTIYLSIYIQLILFSCVCFLSLYLCVDEFALLCFVLLDIIGVELFSSGIGDLYYPSNDMDPYIKDQNVSSNTCVVRLGYIRLGLIMILQLQHHVFQDDDSEDDEEMIIDPTDSVIVCARNEDDFNYLEVSK